MDKLAAALAGFGSNLPQWPQHHSAAGLDPDIALEVAQHTAAHTAGHNSATSGSGPGGGWRGVGYVRVDGSHDSTERHAAVKRFKNDPTCRVALLSITAAAVGESSHIGIDRRCCRANSYAVLNICHIQTCPGLKQRVDGGSCLPSNSRGALPYECM